MDLAVIGVSAVCSALLFLALEFSIILPLFIRVVKKATIDAVNDNLLPSITAYINDKIDSLKTEISDSILAKIRGMLGGRSKGVNRVMQRLADGESLDEIEDDYQESTITQVLNIVSAVADRLPAPSKEKQSHGKEKDNQEESGAPSLLLLQKENDTQA